MLFTWSNLYLMENLYGSLEKWFYNKSIQMEKTKSEYIGDFTCMPNYIISNYK